VDGKPVVVLPGFPTSAIFTFHAFVAPVIRARAGLTPEAAHNIEAALPVRIASALGRKEFVLVALTAGEGGPVAFPTAKGSGAVTSFSQADGFLEIDALAGALDAGSRARVTLIGERAAMPDLVVMGSHCVALDVVLGALAERGFVARTIAIGSMGGVASARVRSCAGASRRHLERNLQRASAAAWTRPCERLAAHAGLRAPPRRCPFCWTQRG
jgi:putative molybdopterin biosynthesis protein